MRKAIYAFSINEDGSILESIATHTYDSDDEEQRQTAIKSIQEEIQWRDAKEVFILDAQKLHVIPVNTIQI